MVEGITFIGIDRRRKGVVVAYFRHDFGKMYPVRKQSLISRIENLKRDGLDSEESEKGLRAIEVAER